MALAPYHDSLSRTPVYGPISHLTGESPYMDLPVAAKYDGAVYKYESTEEDDEPVTTYIQPVYYIVPVPVPVGDPDHYYFKGMSVRTRFRMICLKIKKVFKSSV